MNPGKYGSNKRAEAIDELYPEIGYNDSISTNSMELINTKHMSKFQKTHNLESKDFSVIEEPKLGGNMPSKSVNDALDIFKKLNEAPDKKVTVKKISYTPSKRELFYQPNSLGRKESRLTTGTVDGVPIMKNQTFQEVNGEMIQLNLELFIPNKSGLEKLSKSKPKLAKGGSVDKSLYADQKYI